MFKLKLIVAAAVLLLGGSGAAFASTGHVPEAVKALVGASQGYGQSTSQGVHSSAVDDQYSGGGVSDIAKDKSVTGTMTLPNGKVIENHGLAVSQAAKAQHGDEGNGDPSQTQGQRGEDHSNQPPTQAHQGGENGPNLPQPPVSTPQQGSQNGRP